MTRTDDGDTIYTTNVEGMMFKGRVVSAEATVDKPSCLTPLDHEEGRSWSEAKHNRLQGKMFNSQSNLLAKRTPREELRASNY